MSARQDWPRRRVEPDAEAARADFIAASNDVAKGVNSYNARVSAAVDSLLAHAARWAVGLVGGCVLFAHLLNVLEQGL